MHRPRGKFSVLHSPVSGGVVDLGPVFDQRLLGSCYAGWDLGPQLDVVTASGGGGDWVVFAVATIVNVELLYVVLSRFFRNMSFLVHFRRTRESVNSVSASTLAVLADTRSDLG